MSFDGEVVIVTGASSGIGAATAIKFAEEGAKVCLIGRNRDKLNNIAKKCRNHLVLVADVSMDEDANRIISETIKHFGKLDVLVNNAGILGSGSIFDKSSIKVFDQVIATNLRAPVLLTHLAVPYLIKTKGNIVNISAVASVRVVPKLNFAYNTSKAGLDHFTRSVAMELAASGVRVNNVNPGPVYTSILENTGASADQVQDMFENFKKMTALERVSEPEEVADVVLFLASNKAKAITGSSYFTDNGFTLK